MARRRLIRRLGSITGLLLAAGAAHGQTWQGPVELPSGEIEITIKLAERADDWVGTLDIPAQSVVRAPLVDIEWGEEGALVFRAAIEGMEIANQPVFRLKMEEGNLSGTVLQGPMSFKTALQRTSDTAEMGRSQEPSLPLSYRAIEVTIPVEIDGELAHEMAGTLTLPDTEKFGDGPYPAAVLLSGSGPQDRDESIMGHKPFYVLSDRLTRAGIAVLRCDDRGTGLSGGTFVGATMAERAEDARAQVRWLAERKDIGKIGLIGHSEGGIIAPMVAADSDGDDGEDKDDVSYLVLLAGPSVPGGQIIAEQSAEMSRRSGANEAIVDAIRTNNLEVFSAIGPEATDEQLLEVVTRVATQQRPDMPELMRGQVVDAMLTQLSDPWLRHFVQFDPATVLSRVDEPVLALFGEKDVQVLPWQNVDPAREALKDNADATVEVLDGLNHLFQPAKTGLIDEYGASEITFDEGVMERIAAWINERFGKAEGE